MDYTRENRGKIQHRDRARQIVDFSNLKYGNITPTDIDGFIEYHGIGMMFIELKYKDAEIPYGQRLAYERLVDDVNNGILYLCSHDVADCNQDIDASQAIVKKIYYKGQWHTPHENMTLEQEIRLFVDYLNRQEKLYEGLGRLV